jgi:hypothetical protein
MVGSCRTQRLAPPGPGHAQLAGPSTPAANLPARAFLATLSQVSPRRCFKGVQDECWCHIPPLRRRGLVIGPLGLVLGSLFQVAGDDDSVSLAKIAAHPSGERAVIICDLLAAFMVPAVLSLMRLTGPRARG